MGTPSDEVGNEGNRGGGDDDDDNGPGPTSCEDEDDCIGECPPGALDCTCHDGPNGPFCVPTCNSDADCIFGGPMSFTCNEAEGVCVPG
jgi:hypothetical protein